MMPTAGNRRAAQVAALLDSPERTDDPAMAGIGVSRLWDSDALVELQGYAVL